MLSFRGEVLVKKDNRIRIRLIGADTERSLQYLINHGISLYDIHREDMLNAAFSVAAGDHTRVKNLLAPKGDQIEILSTVVMDFILEWLKKRVVLLAGCLLLVALSFYIPSRIFFIQVEGNQQIPKRLILESAAQQGLRFGCERKLLRSNILKNSLLT